MNDRVMGRYKLRAVATEDTEEARLWAKEFNRHPSTHMFRRGARSAAEWYETELGLPLMFIIIDRRKDTSAQQTRPRSYGA